MVAREEEKNEEIEAAFGDIEVHTNEELLNRDATAPITAASVTPVESKNDDEEAGNKQIKMKVAADAPWGERMWEVFSTFWPLGLVAFGGPTVS